MNQDGAPKPKSTIGSVSGSPHEDTITNHKHLQHLTGDDNKYVNSSHTPNLLARCAQSDKGGGVGLNHEVFAIYSTAALPPLWTDILHTPAAAGEISSTTGRLHALAKKISASLPMYTSWKEIAHSPLPHGTLEIHSLNTSPSTTHAAHHPIHRAKPHFLLNASLHARHCIVGQHSKTETLLVVLRRPWCVLEICVSNVHDVDVLARIEEFARVAQEVDAAGYGTAVFLLGVEIDARRRRHNHQRMMSRDYDVPASTVYKLCNSAVFIPSLRSYNSFWIRLICVCAIELGISFSYMVRMLCGQQQLLEHDEGDAGCCKSDTAIPGTVIIPNGGRRHSTIELHSSCRRIEEEKNGDIVQKMLDLYRHVLTRTADCI